MNQAAKLLNGIQSKSGKETVLEFYQAGNGNSSEYEYVAKMVKAIESDMKSLLGGTN